MKTASKILIVISAALLAAFAVKNIIDYSRYVKIGNSAPFDLRISLNALFIVLPAAIIAAIALFLERKTRVLAICAAFFTAVCVEELTRHISVRHFTDSDGLLLALPYIASAVIFAVFLILSEMKSGSGKTLSTALFVISGAIAAVFVVMCLDQRGLDNIMQFFAGIFFYALFFLLPAAIIAVTALFLRGKTILLIAGAVYNVLLAELITGAVVSVLIAALILLLTMPWIMTIPALASAAVCTVLAINCKKRGKE